MKKEELSWAFGDLEEGSGMADGEKKKEKEREKEQRKKMVNRKLSLKYLSSTWIL